MTAAKELEQSWKSQDRWKGIQRDYSAEEVMRLRPSLKFEHTLARHTSEKLWNRLEDSSEAVRSLGALTGAQAVQFVKAGLSSLYVSGWQVAADGNLAGETYPDQSLYPCNSVPRLVYRINQGLKRADQIHSVDAQGESVQDWYAPVVADAEAGFGGPLHAYELMSSMIEAGAAGVHFEDQLASEKKCGHLGGKVLVPTEQFVRSLKAARLAADVLDVPTVLIARTDALSAGLLTSDWDERDQAFLTGGRSSEGFFRVKGGMEAAIVRALAYAPYADLLWFETSRPDLGEAKEFADAIHAKFPGKKLAYNCSPSFHWRGNLDEKTIQSFHERLAEMNYRYQFITLAGWHALNHVSFQLARSYQNEGMPAYVLLQEEEMEAEQEGYTATRHQREVGTGYFDEVLRVVTGGQGSTGALDGSTEKEQFQKPA